MVKGRWRAAATAGLAAGIVAGAVAGTTVVGSVAAGTSSRVVVTSGVRIGSAHRLSTSRAASLLGDYVVRTSDAAAQARVVAWAAAHQRGVPNQFRALHGAVLTLPAADVAAVRSIPGVLTVDRDRPVTIAGTEGSATWGLDRIDQRSVSLDAAYHYAATGAGVKAYVVDTGLRLTHTDFAGRVGLGAYIDFGDGTQETDCNGHGTHVSGTLGGTVYGVAKGVTIVPVKVLSCDGSGSNQTVISGLDWVLSDHRAGEPAVVNLSLGGPASTDVDAAIQQLVDAGITVVVAAGNEHANACDTSPARVPAAITVGAVDRSDAEAPFSNYGSCVDLFAPGVDITSDWATSDNAAALASGTSMATPHVAGAAALVLQTHPTATPAQVWATLKATATVERMTFQAFDVGSPSLILYTGPIAVPSAPSAPTATPGNTTVTVAWNAPGSDGNMPVTGYRVQRSTDGVTWTTVTTVKPTLRTLLVGNLGNGVPYRFRVAAVNYVGAGPDSPASTAVAPRTRPGVVRVSAQPLDRGAQLTWSTPSSDGGAAVRSYRIERSTDGIHWTTVTLSAPLSRTFVVTGLTNAVTYRFRVAAANIAGPGAWSAWVAAAPRPVPSSPGRPTTVAASHLVRLSWAAPRSQGGAPVTAYRVLKSVNGITWVLVTATASTARTLGVPGLVNGVTYRFRVAAVNRYGIGAWSPTASATPHV